MATTKAEMKHKKNMTDAEKVQMADDNHIWVNAFSCIRPTDEFLLGVGRTVIDKLNNSDMCCEILGEPLTGMKYLYLSINKS